MEEEGEEDAILLNSLGVTSANPEEIERRILDKGEGRLGEEVCNDSTGNLPSSAGQVELLQKLRAVDVEIDAVASTVEQAKSARDNDELETGSCDGGKDDGEDKVGCNKAISNDYTLQHALAADRLRSLKKTRAELRQELSSACKEEIEYSGDYSIAEEEIEDSSDDRFAKYSGLEFSGFSDEEEEEEVDRTELCGYEVGEVDSSEAIVLEFDGNLLKKTSPLYYENLIYFSSFCLQKRYLKLFTHPGCGLVDYWLFELFGSKAVEEYNNLLTKSGKAEHSKLKFLDLIKVYELDGCGMYYLTFTALDEKTCTVDRYQAALMEPGSDEDCDDCYTLGLFKRANDDKVLAVLSVKGGEEDLAKRVRVVDAALEDLRLANQMKQTVG